MPVGIDSKDLYESPQATTTRKNKGMEIERVEGDSSSICTSINADKNCQFEESRKVGVTAAPVEQRKSMQFCDSN